MATVKVMPGSQDWHIQRSLGIGGSECAALFNEGYGCHRRLVMEKRGLEPDYHRPKREEDILERGNELEDIVADKFTRETGLKVRRQPAKVSPTHPHARVNMDRQIIGSDPEVLVRLTKLADVDISPLERFLVPGATLGPGVLECKTMNEYDFKRLLNEGLEKHPHYVLQIQHTFAVTGYKWGFFAVLEPTWWQFKIFLVTRNEKLCRVILNAVEATWEAIQKQPDYLPDRLPDGDKRCRNCLYRKTCRGEQYLASYAGADFSTDYTEVSSPTVVELAVDYRDAVEAVGRAQEVVDVITERIKAELEAAGLSKVIVPEVIKFCWTQNKGRSGWDSKALDGETQALRKDGLVEIATRIENCKKVSAPSRTFRTYNV